MSYKFLDNRKKNYHSYCKGKLQIWIPLYKMKSSNLIYHKKRHLEDEVKREI